MHHPKLSDAIVAYAYTDEQIAIIISDQTQSNAFSTQLAHAAGLRADELLTLCKSSERDINEKTIATSPFLGLDGHIYTVTGIGGIVREVIIPFLLATQLENLRLAEPRTRINRGLSCTQNYAISGGQAWSQSFSSVSLRKFGWSYGAIGLLDCYAQRRWAQLRKLISFPNDEEMICRELGFGKPDFYIAVREILENDKQRYRLMAANKKLRTTKQTT